MRNFTIPTLLVLSMSLASCDLVKLDRILVENRSIQSVGNIRISYGGTLLSRPRLEPGQKWITRAEPASGGSLSISYTIGPDQIEVAGNEYIVPEELRWCEIIILPAGATIDC